jgi:hypothetical protein
MLRVSTVSLLKAPTHRRAGSGLTISAWRALLFAATALFAVQYGQRSDAQAPQDQASSTSFYTLLIPGMLTSPAFDYAFTGAKFRVVARNLVVGHAKASGVPTPVDMVMELRGGAVTITLNGQTQEKTAGDFWTVEKGSRLDVENKGQVAVIRAIYFYPGAT